MIIFLKLRIKTKPTYYKLISIWLFYLYTDNINYLKPLLSFAVSRVGFPGKTLTWSLWPPLHFSKAAALRGAGLLAHRPASPSSRDTRSFNLRRTQPKMLGMSARQPNVCAKFKKHDLASAGNREQTARWRKKVSFLAAARRETSHAAPNGFRQMEIEIMQGTLFCHPWNPHLRLLPPLGIDRSDNP